MPKHTKPITPGAECWDVYLDDFQTRRVGVVANQTSRVGDEHLVDFLVRSGVEVAKVFAPEHGFRGAADAGEHVADGRDLATGLEVVSLYGKNRKPEPKYLDDLQLMIYDIQDVGARFYTYISTLHLVMEACADAEVPIVVLDRPNPHGGYVDGPVLEPEYQSFVGMHPIPVIYDMTPGELARMIDGERWLNCERRPGGPQCELAVVQCRNYRRDVPYSLPVVPSPNLLNDHAIALYPSLCFFEGTPVSVGRGTSSPFEVFGHPSLTGPYQFTPQPMSGAKDPKRMGETCHGRDLREFIPEQRLHLEFLRRAYADYPEKAEFFTPFFTKLAGTTTLQQQIESGLDEEEIRASWQPGISRYLEMRQQYLLYAQHDLPARPIALRTNSNTDVSAW